MKHSLLIRTEGDETKIIHSVQRPKNFNFPEGQRELARIMEMEFNGISLAFQDIVNFWVDKGMMSKEQACGIMAQFCIDMVKKEESSDIEIFNANDIARLPALSDVLKVVR